jgi:hypothetical protein
MVDHVLEVVEDQGDREMEVEVEEGLVPSMIFEVV